jgi:molecular chaperone GrpE
LAEGQPLAAFLPILRIVEKITEFPTMQQPTDKDLHEELTAPAAEEKETTDKSADTESLGPEAASEAAADTSLQQQLDEQKDKYLRLYSEFENFRRRTAKEKLEMIATAGEGIATALLPVLDDFERALKAMPADDSSYEGFQLIYHKLQKTLEQKGVKAMDVAKGSEFDAEKMEAITQFPAPEEELKGKVIDVVEQGYTMGEKVIRFAKVVTGA